MPFLRPQAESPENLPYRLQDDFLSPAGLYFYKVLSSVRISLYCSIQGQTGGHFLCSSPGQKPRLLQQNCQKALRFSGRDAATMRPLLGIELNDVSHQRENRQKRDRFIERVFDAAKLPLLRFPVQREYNPGEIAAKIAPYLRESVVSPPAPEPASKPAAPADNDVPLRPKCGIPMVLRTVTQREHKGKQFYSCVNSALS